MDIDLNRNDVDHLGLDDFADLGPDFNRLLNALATSLETVIYSYDSSLSLAGLLKNYLGMPNDSQVESIFIPRWHFPGFPKRLNKFDVEFIGRRIESVPLYSPFYSRFFRYSLHSESYNIEEDDDTDDTVEEPGVYNDSEGYGTCLKLPDEDTLYMIDEMQIFGFKGEYRYSHSVYHDELTTIEVWSTRITSVLSSRRLNSELKGIFTSFPCRHPILNNERLNKLELAYLESKWNPEKGESISLHGMEFLKHRKELDGIVEGLELFEPSFCRSELRGRPTGHDLTRKDTIFMSGEAIRKLSAIIDKKPTQAQVARELQVGVSTYNDYLRDYDINWRTLLTKSLSNSETELI